MPGLGAEAMIFLYAGLSGLTVLAGYDCKLRRQLQITVHFPVFLINETG